MIARLLPPTRYLIVTFCFTLISLKTVADETLSTPKVQAYLSLQTIVMGDPKGKIDTYFADNSVATEAVEFSPDGQFFASVSKSKGASAQLTLWLSADASSQWQQSLDGETECVTFTKNGRYILTGGENKKGSGALHAFDTQSGEKLDLDFSKHYPKSIEGMRFSPNGKMLATGDEAGQIVIWDSLAVHPKDWFVLAKLSVKNHTNAVADVNQIDWTQDSKFIVSAERDGDVDMYRVSDLITQQATGPYRRFLGFAGNTVKSVRIAANGKYVAAGAGSTQGVRVWDLQSASLVAHIPSEPVPNANSGKLLNAERYETIAFSPDSKYLLVGGTWPAWWFAANQQENKAYTVPIVAFLLSDLSNADLPLESARIQKFDAWRSEYFDFHPTGSMFVSGHDDGSIRLWRVKQATP